MIPASPQPVAHVGSKPRVTAELYSGPLPVTRRAASRGDGLLSRKSNRRHLDMDRAAKLAANDGLPRFQPPCVGALLRVLDS